MPTQRAAEIANAFTKYAKTGDKSIIKQYTREEIETTLLQYHLDKGWAHYIAMEKRIEELKEEEIRSREKKEKWYKKPWILTIIAIAVAIIFGIPAYILLFNPQKVVIIKPSSNEHLLPQSVSISTDSDEFRNISSGFTIEQTDNNTNQAVSKTELSIVTKDKTLSPISLDQFYETYYNNSLTDLQQEDFVNKQMNRRMVWEGLIRSVEEETDGTITILIYSKKRENNKAFCKFNKEHREDLLELKPKQYIRVTGVLRNVVASPFLRECKLLEVLQ